MAVDVGKDTAAVVVTVKSEGEHNGALVVATVARGEVVDGDTGEAVSTGADGELTGTNGGAEMFRSGIVRVTGNIGWDTNDIPNGWSIGWSM